MSPAFVHGRHLIRASARIALKSRASKPSCHCQSKFFEWLDSKSNVRPVSKLRQTWERAYSTAPVRNITKVLGTGSSKTSSDGTKLAFTSVFHKASGSVSSYAAFLL